jgi:hypothetical protein
MNNKIVSSKSQKQVESFNFLELARRTAFASSKTYHLKSRPISFKRLWHFLIPNFKQPIFIVGAPRSGTTFLGDCLAAIPDISYHFEPVATKAATRYIYQGEWGMTKAKFFYRQVYGWLMRQHLDADLRFAEKTPQNCFIIDFLSQAFPNAKFVHIIRDGRDVALSYSKKPWLQASQAESGKFEPGGYRYGPYARFWVEPERIREFETTSDIHRCIWAWRRFTESAIEAGAKLPPIRYYEVRYEKLVSNLTDEDSHLLEFLEITDSQSCLSFQKAISKAKVDSVGRWEKELANEQVSTINKEAGFLLKKLGY